MSVELENKDLTSNDEKPVLSEGLLIPMTEFVLNINKLVPKDADQFFESWQNETANGTKHVLGEVKFVPNTNYSRTTHSDIDYYIGVNGKVKTKFFGK